MEHPALKFKKDKNWVRIRQKTFSAPGGGRMNNVEWLGERSRRKEKERKKREKWAGVMKRWGRLWESKSPLLKLTRKPVAVGTASSTVTQVFSTRQFKKIFAHAPFFTFSSWKNQVKQNADLLDYSFPFISQKLSFHFVCCVQPRSWRIFVGGRSKCRLEKKKSTCIAFCTRHSITFYSDMVFVWTWRVFHQIIINSAVNLTKHQQMAEGNKIQIEIWPYL